MLQVARKLAVASQGVGEMTRAIPVAVLIGFALLTPPPAGAISSRTLTAPKGSAANDFVGRSVAEIGDVNGDGYPDLITGATGAGGSGAAYIHYGGPTADANADVTLTGEASNNQFGISVAGLGDVNADGYPDVIVGAQGHSTLTGRAYIFYGGPSLVSEGAANADVILTGEAVNNLFGASVSTAGDVNGDGRPDVLVGASGHNSNAGRAYVFFAGSTLISKPAANADVIMTGEAGSRFGFAAAAAGDASGDGRPDIVVGAYSYTTNTGRAYVFYGGRSFTGSKAATSAEVILTGEATGVNFGSSVSSAGDMNGDGRTDILVGSSGANAGTGRAYVFYGGPFLLTKTAGAADVIITGESGIGAFGNAVDSAGDVDGDGYGDIVIGAVTYASNMGRAYLFLGGVSFTGTEFAGDADLILTGEAAGDLLGTSISGAGDFNGDGFGDIAVGISGFLSSAGRVYVTAVYPYQIVSPNGGERWTAGRPAAVRWLGHDPADVSISLDGGMSWTVLASGAGGGAENRISVIAPSLTSEGALIRVAYGGQSVARATSDLSDRVFSIAEENALPAILREATLAGSVPSGFFGSSVADLGDVNGDGYRDQLVGAPEVGSSSGTAYVFFGGPNGDAIPDVTLTGQTNSRFGAKVASAGDVNGDGIPDLLVSGPGYSNNTGRAYLFYGGPGLVSEGAAAADAIVTGEGTFNELGYSISCAGDLNRDGLADVIIGGPGASSNAGRAYVFYGGSAFVGSKPASGANLILTGESNTTLGTGVACAGDMNGDGRDDLVVGAYQFNGFGGKAYIFYGGPTLSGTRPAAGADVILTSEGSGNQFGGNVAAAGDLNGDGLGDVIVGAVGYGSNTGRAYIFLGGPFLTTRSAGAADVILTGELAGGNFGGAVAGAGDVNADGLSDVIVAAPNYGSFQGRAYLFLGGASLVSKSASAADLILDKEATNESFGSSVCSAGDLHGDGFSDLLVGGPGTGTGRAFLYDLNRYHLLSPAAGDTWNVGANQTISWLGAEPADLWLSVDGGGSYQLLRQDAGGNRMNTVAERVPHLPTRFARIRLTPANEDVAGNATSDSLFTIQSSVALLAFRAEESPGGGMELSWNTEPTVGPQGIAGYRLYRLGPGTGGAGLRIGPDPITESRFVDADGGPGAGYRLASINGLGEELELGQISMSPVRELSAGPLPYRGGNLGVSFVIFGPLGARSGAAEVGLYDLAGRLVRSIARGSFDGTRQTAIWDGRDMHGNPVPAGIYFLRARSGGHTSSLKLSVVR